MKVKIRVCIISIFFVFPYLLFQKPGFAQTTWIVDQGGGGDFTAIQDCIDAASDSDTCQVNAGTYYENIDFIGKDLTVVSTSGPEVTILDGSASGSVVTFQNYETEDAVLDGFTVQNGIGTEYESVIWGGGIYGMGSSPTISNCFITDNTYAGGIAFNGGSPTITNSAISGNYACTGGAAGIVCINSSFLTMTDCTISGNYAAGSWMPSSPVYGGGILCAGGSILTMTNCLVTGNHAIPGGATYGGGVVFFSASGTLTNCTISGNAPVTYGGGIFCFDSSFVLSNSILWADTAWEGSEIAIASVSSPSSVTVSYSDVQGGQPGVYVGPDSTLNWGEGNIDQDPLFVGTDDYHLLLGSLCVDSGTDVGVYEDIDGQVRPLLTGFDMGVDEYDGPCWDLDSDGHLTEQCGGDDCDDSDPDVNPGITEIPGNGIDDDCNPGTPPYGTPASVVGTEYERSSGVTNTLLLLLPIAGVVFLRVLRTKR